MLNIKKNLLKTRISVLLAPISFFIARLALAAGEGGIKNPLGTNKLETVIANIVKGALGLTAVLAVGFIVYGGFLYITAAGDDSQIKKGKEALVGAVIGIIVIGLAYSLVAFVIGAVGAGGGTGGIGGEGNN